MKTQRKDNCMDILEKFLVKHNKKSQLKGFYSILGKSKAYNLEPAYANLTNTMELPTDVHISPIQGTTGGVTFRNDYNALFSDNLIDDNSYSNIKKLALMRLKGHALLAVSKHKGSNISRSFTQWKIRAVKRYGTECLMNLIVKSKLSSYTMIWRFKQLIKPYYDHKINVKKFVRIIEHKIYRIKNKNNELNNEVLEKIKGSARQNTKTYELRKIDQFSDTLDSI